MNLIEMSLY